MPAWSTNRTVRRRQRCRRPRRPRRRHSAATEIIFIDGRVPDAWRLADELMRSRGDGRMFSIAILAADEDGVAQIGRALESERDLAAIHLVSHGADGALEIGATRLDQARLAASAEAVAAWGRSLASGADLLLYGCGVAQTAAGQAFVNEIARLTGADVAASTDLTGHSAFGGDWALEYARGRITADALFDAAFQHAWTGTLAIAVDPASSAATVTTGSSLNFLHTVGTGANRLLLVEVALADNEAVTSVRYGGAPLTLLSAVTESGDKVRAELWYLVAPASGTHAVDVSLGTSKRFTAGAVSFSNVNQLTPLGAPIALSGSGSAPSVVMTSNAGDLVLDLVSMRDRDGATVGPAQTALWTNTTGNGSADSYGAGSIEPGAASVTMSWASVGAGAGEWAAIAVSIKANAPPVLTTSGGTLAYAENQVPTPIDPALALSDADSASLAGATVCIDIGYESGADLLAFTDQNGISGSWNAATGVLTLSGSSSIANYRTALRSVVYSNTNDAPSAATRSVAFTATDGTLTSGAASRLISVTPVNDAPFLDSSRSPMLAAIIEDSSAPIGAVGTLVSALVDPTMPAGGLDNVSDPDSAAEYGIAIIAAANANGTWHYSTDSGRSWQPLGGVGPGAARLLAADSDTRVYFQPNPDWNGTLASAITFRAWDQTNGLINGGLANTTVNGGSSAYSNATDTASLVVNPVNDAPVLDNSGTMSLPNGLQDAAAPAGMTVAALIASASGDRIADVDAGAVEGVAITAASSSIGTWQYSTDGGSIWNAVGSVSNAQARLLGATPSDMIRFVSNPGASGSASFSFRAWDRSEGQSSGTPNIDTASNGGSTPFSTATQVASVYVEPLQVILWLSTSGDVAASGVPGAANWSQSSVLAVGDPGLSFGSGSTGGRVSSVVDFDGFGSDVDIVGLHRVGRAVTLSGTGITGGSISLQAGDVLFVTAAAETLATGASTPPVGWSSSIGTAAGGVYAYRPASVGDYGSGYFRHIITDPGANTTREIALVETATSVGGTVLAAGDLLFTQTGNLQQNSIYWYRTASDSNTQLISGAQVGIPGGGGGGVSIDSLDLVQGSFTAGGVAFQAGDLLVGFDKQVSGVGGGSSTLIAMPQDVVRMRFSATTSGAGTAVAGAAMVFDGDGDAKFDTAAENIDAISLLVRSAGGNLPPTLTLPGPALAYAEGSGAVLVDVGTTVTDLDSIDLDTGVLFVDFRGSGTASDRLGIRNQGTAPGQIGIAGTDVSHGGVLIGNLSGGTDGSTPLVISLNANATPAAVQALLRNLTYSNVSNNPSTVPRTLRLLLSDGDGATSSPVTKVINITNVNDPPIASVDAYSTREDTSLVIAPSTAGLTNWWGFNEGGSSQTTASSGTLGNGGTRGSTAGTDASDPSWDGGLLGGAGLSFDGAGQHVQTSSTELSTAAAFSLSAWYRADATSGAQHLLWQGYAGGNGHGDAGSTSPATSEMSLSIGGNSATYNNRLVFSLGYDVPANGADSILIVSASDFSDTSRWHHVAVSVADIGGGVMRASLYVDGRLEGSGTGTQNDRSAWGALRIGAAGDGSRAFKGRIDEVRIYAAELTGSQVLAVMQPGVLANDSDADSAPLQVDPTLVSGPANGTLALHADGSFSYTPNADFHGTDSFSYRASDGIAQSTPATVTISVSPVADTPSVTGATTDEDTQSSTGLVITRNPADGAEVTHFKITAISNGSLFQKDGTTPIVAGSFISFAEANAGLRFTPVAGFHGSGSFLVQASRSASDADLGGAAVLATVTVTPVNDAPTTSPVTLVAIVEDSGARLITQAELLANAADVDGPSLTAIGLVISSGSGALLDNGNGTWTYTPAANDDTGVGFSYWVTDGSLSAPGSATLDITPVNDAPTTAESRWHRSPRTAGRG